MPGKRWWAAGLGLGLAAPAMAWQLAGASWVWQAQPVATPVTLYVASFDPSLFGAPSAVRDALLRALDVWNTEGFAPVTLSYGGTTTLDSWTSDGRFVVAQATTPAAGATLAVSQSWSIGADLVDCDQRVYTSNGLGSIAWSTDPTGAPPGGLDLSLTLVHELGHCLGLAHSADPNAIMYASVTTGRGYADRHLHPDDRAGLQAMYGATLSTAPRLHLSGMLVAGQAATASVDGATPGAAVRLVLGPDGVGAGPCLRAWAGACLDVSGTPRTLGLGVADANGQWSGPFSVPTVAAGRRVGLQVVTRDGTDVVLSEAWETPVLPAGATCGVGAVFDCNGVCADPARLGDGACDDGSGPSGADFACPVFNADQGDCPL
ncbi:MAG: hypothetical protein RLZZ383_2169 [Pseudomonadota bacterium]